MEAGQELDVWIAKEFLGIDLTARCGGELWDVDATAKCMRCSYRASWDNYQVDHTVQPLPYSTDIAAAWRVIDRLMDRFPQVRFERAGSNTWYAKLWNFDHSIIGASAPTAPHAICLLARKVVEPESSNAAES